MGYPLKGITVIAVEQAAAAPYPSSRLADAGARVIKIERPQGDFARGYDNAVRGDSTYFVWLNRGKSRSSWTTPRRKTQRCCSR
jgi:itaconate CoA-transferase